MAKEMSAELTPLQAVERVVPGMVKQRGGDGHWLPAASDPRVVRIGGTSTTAKRLVYALVRGAVAPGVELRSKCGSKFCLNPDHQSEEPARGGKRSASLSRAAALDFVHGVSGGPGMRAFADAAHAARSADPELVRTIKTSKEPLASLARRTGLPPVQVIAIRNL